MRSALLRLIRPRTLTVVFATLALAAVSPDSLAQTAAPPALSIRQMVLDIISFTRWPAPRPDLRLCVVGQPVYAAAFFEIPMQSGAIPVHAERIPAGDDRLGTGCDALYIGPMTLPERGAVSRRIAGHSILTIGEPDPACIEATMFCLQLNGPELSFATNLDAVARSGVRLNPRVLLLGRHPPRTP